MTAVDPNYADDPERIKRVEAMVEELTEARREGRPIPIARAPDRKQTCDTPKRADGRTVIGWLCRHHAGYGIIRPRRMQTMPAGGRKVAAEDIGKVLAPSWSIIGRILAEIDTPPEDCTAQADARLLVDVLCDALLEDASGLLSQSSLERCKAARVIVCGWDLDDSRTARAHDHMVALIGRIEARIGVDVEAAANLRAAQSAPVLQVDPQSAPTDWLTGSFADLGRAIGLGTARRCRRDFEKLESLGSIEFRDAESRIGRAKYQIRYKNDPQGQLYREAKDRLEKRRSD